ncbi:MAG: hypothetical protein D8M58_08080 [Calditrichaeota bacterium]|nr:MAG: hypothetical protein DWQ03_18410 [Calditrichota bacterium]MBL1205340.1 hypothetical protein [Calditrichota bacterium]NOG45169.1 hypothetical protein [Calditrichota bacterium]
MAEKTIKYKNEEITVLWKPGLCIHSAKCVGGLPSVFDVKRKPWIDVNAATAENIMKTINTCPSQALSYLKTKGDEEEDGKLLEVNMMKNGPLLLSGSFCVKDADGNIIKEGDKAALCRCGASANKPFCDGQHKQIGFKG